MTRLPRVTLAEASAGIAVLAVTLGMYVPALREPAEDWLGRLERRAAVRDLIRDLFFFQAIYWLGVVPGLRIWRSRPREAGPTSSTVCKFGGNSALAARDDIDG
jgi:hypothetical protein